MTDASALSKAEFTALDLINALPDKTARVNARANLGKGIIARKTAELLVATGKARYLDGGLRITTDEWEYASTEGGVIEVPAGQGEATGDALQQIAADQEAEAKPEKVNGRKAAAEKSPYSTATPTNRIKRHGKSRRTGTMTEIEDGLAKGSTFQVEGSGRYAVRCLTHKAETFVPDMTTAKPLQARTDQFCGQCDTLVKAGAKHTDEAKAS